jgi:Putative zinc-finger
MRCEAARESLVALLDGELSGLTAWSMRRHVARCGDCASEFVSLRNLNDRLRSLDILQRHAVADRRLSVTAASPAPPRGSRRDRCRVAQDGSTQPRQVWSRGTVLPGLAALGLLTMVALEIDRWSHGPARRQQPSPLVGQSGPAPNLPSSPPAPPLRVASRPTLAPTLNSIPSNRSAHDRNHERKVSAWRSSPTPDSHSTSAPVLRPPSVPLDDLFALERNRIEAQVRRNAPIRDDFVQIPFPRLADLSGRQIAAAVEIYQREAAIVDARLSREVTLQQKATALSDLCDRLRADTGIQLGAGPSVADEKVTLFCEKLPLRDVMRQLSRPFGYAWLRSGKAGEYRYELVQDLRSQLLEEELRNRDRNAALLALEQELEKYRPYLSLSPDELLARAKTAPPAEKKLLENLSGLGYGAIQMYFRPSPQEMAAIRAGQWLAFSTGPQPGEPPLPRVPFSVFAPGERQLPPDVARGILQCWRQERVHRGPRGLGLTGPDEPGSVPVASVPEVHAWLTLSLDQSELGQYRLEGNSGFRASDGLLRGNIALIGAGRSPKVLQPDNETANVRLAGESALRPRLSLQPQPSCRATPAQTASSESPLEPKVTTADVLETLHRATRLPLVADAYTRLYKLEGVTVRNQPRFAALNRLSDAMRLRWNKDGNWLQFRSTSFYDDRLKEVPNRLLTRWAAARRQHGFLTLEDLVEIAQLPDAPLKGEEMAEGARLCYGFAEWDTARNQWVLANLRFLAQLTPAQRQEAMTSAGLPFARMTLAQQQEFIDRTVGSRAILIQEGEGLQSLEDLAGATLRVDYSQPGWYEWRPPGDALRWVVPLGPPPDGRWLLTPVVRERTREAVLQALRRGDPQIREAVWKAVLRAVPGNEPSPPSEEAQIAPSKLELTTLYVPGTTRFPVQFQSTNRQSAAVGW